MIVAGAALTATSVGITARVLNDLGRLHEPESRIVLGAAVIDDILGLIILTVVSGMAEKTGPNARSGCCHYYRQGIRLSHRRARARAVSSCRRWSAGCTARPCRAC